MNKMCLETLPKDIGQEMFLRSHLFLTELILLALREHEASLLNFGSVLLIRFLASGHEPF